MKTCSKCHKNFGDEMVFCPYCGEKLEETKQCPKCKKDVPAESAFCPYCGADLAASKVEPEPEEVAQEVVDNDGYKKERVYTEEQLNAYRRQLENYKRKRANFSLAGGLLLGIGIIGLILGLILVIVNALIDSPASTGLIIFGAFLLGLSFFAINGGIPLIVVASALFSKRIENRERILKE